MPKGWPNRDDGHGAYHTCMRSGIKGNLDDMVWEQGRLVDPKFSDTLAGGPTALVGSLEARWDQIIKHDNTDLQPHPKLQQSNVPDDDVYFE